MNEKLKNTKPNSGVVWKDEIDLMELAKVIWFRRGFIIKVTGLFVVLGFLIAFTSPTEYRTSCTLIPEAMNGEEKIGGSLGGLASLAGIDIGGMNGGTSTINPGLYQSIAGSTPFLLSLMDQHYLFGTENKELSIREYFEDYYHTNLFNKILSLPGLVIGWINPIKEVEELEKSYENIISLTYKEQSIIENLRSRILVTMDYELGVVTIQVEMQDAAVAAQVAEFTRSYITDYVTQYSTSKSFEQLRFIERQLQDRKEEFVQSQLNLARFRDRNRDINISQARSEEERLQSEYNLAFNVYNQLAQQRETIKLKVNKNTPVFTVLEPVKIPNRKSEPKRLLITLVLAFGGIVFSILIVSVNFLKK